MVPALLPGEQTVRLIRTESAEAISAMEGVTDELMAGCYDKKEATALVQSVLRPYSVDDASVRSDGPLAMPSDQRVAVEKHLADGCWIHTGSGYTDDSKPIVYIAGNE